MPVAAEGFLRVALGLADGRLDHPRGQSKADLIRVAPACGQIDFQHNGKKFELLLEGFGQVQTVVGIPTVGVGAGYQQHPLPSSPECLYGLLRLIHPWMRLDLPVDLPTVDDGVGEEELLVSLAVGFPPLADDHIDFHFSGSSWQIPSFDGSATIPYTCEKVNIFILNMMKIYGTIKTAFMSYTNTLLTKRLEQFGLTSKEAEVYVALLPFGEAPIRDLLKTTGIHPQLVYWALNKLQEKKLVSVTYRRHRRYVRAEDPRKLEELEQRRFQDLKQIIPSLVALQSPLPDTIIRVARGSEAVRAARLKILEVLKTGDAELIIGGGGDRYYEIMGEQFAEFERRRIKLGIHKRVVAYADQRQPQTEHADQFRQLAAYRYLPQSFVAPSTTSVYATVTAIYLWSADPSVITIDNKEIAESYRHYFMTLWNVAEE